MKLGTWTTIDCPIKKENEALDFLLEHFSEIGGKVRKIYNDHDFGPYPSFEIDYPSHLEDYIDYDDCYIDEVSDEERELAKQVDEWQDKANEIESLYSKKFEQYL